MVKGLEFACRDVARDTTLAAGKDETKLKENLRSANSTSRLGRSSSS